MDAKILSIVVTFNGEDHIRKCLKSVEESTRTSDVLVIDNASDDETVEIIRKEFPDVSIQVLSENVGFGQANNIGLRKVLAENYDYAFLVNQDAFMEGDSLDALVREAEKNKNLEGSDSIGIFSPIQIKSEGTELHSSFAHYFDESTQKILSDSMGLDGTLIGSTIVPAALWLITRECIEQVGGFDPLFFHYGEDDNYAHRAAYHGFKIGIVTKSIGRHEEAAQNSPKRSYFERQKTFNKLSVIYDLLQDSESEPFNSMIKLLGKRIVLANLLMRWEDARDLRKVRKDLNREKSQIMESVQRAKAARAFL